MIETTWLTFREDELRIDENDNLSLYSLCSVLYMVPKSAYMMIPIDCLTIFVFWAPEAEAIM